VRASGLDIQDRPVIRKCRFCAFCRYAAGSSALGSPFFFRVHRLRKFKVSGEDVPPRPPEEHGLLIVTLRSGARSCTVSPRRPLLLLFSKAFRAIVRVDLEAGLKTG